MSKFTEGNRASKGRGRPPGTPNKRTVEFMAVLEKHNFCPASAMISLYEEARKTYDNYGVIYDAICAAKTEKEGYAAPVQDNAHVYLKLALDAAKELASFSYAKKKSYEQTVDPTLIETFKSLENLSNDELRAIASGEPSCGSKK